jgi:uncharacterized protein (TIGR02284 family)
MSTATKSIASVLNSLIEKCKDGQAGFRSAVEDVQNRDLQSLFSELAMQRQQFAVELQHLVRNLGEEAETAGTMSGALTRGWMDVKAALTSGDEYSVLVECVRGESATVVEYQEALDRGQMPDNIRSVIQHQYMALQAAHDRLRDLRDRFQG